MSQSHPGSVLFICTGNICRSPTAHALLWHKARQQQLAIHVDSAAICDEERGNPPDPRAIAEARRRGIAMPTHRSRQVQRADFERFDLLIGMTDQHLRALQRQAQGEEMAKLKRLLDYAPAWAGRDVPDPWYGSQSDFVHAFDLIEQGVDGLLAELQSQPLARRT